MPFTAYLNIECIGDDTDALIKNATRLLGERLMGKYPASHWVAEITGFDDKFGYQRIFLPYNKDYSHANSKGSRGVYAHYILEQGRIYEVKEPISWKNTIRYFCTVDADGDIVKITKEDVDECLNEISG